MRLSEAIRLGANLGPQLYGQLIDGKGGSCAWGAAYLAVGDMMYQFRHSELLDAHGWRELAMAGAICPACPDRENQILQDVIVHLNNLHHWTRERIADWVELEELALFGPTAPEELPDPIPAPEEAPLEVALVKGH